MFAGYTIERLLGVGGMGEVYLAQHPRLPKRDALKVLPIDVSSNTEFRQRFQSEAALASRLWHPHIVRVHDRGEFEGQLWIAMDFVDGTDAAQLVRKRYPHGMPPTDALEIVSAIADALDYAHERKLLHRDVKPANILITDPLKRERRILLADFGIARDTDDVNRLTATNMAVGSVAYAAPEQLTGKVLDGRADQYALACTAFHLLTGRPPFEHSNPAVVIGNHLSSLPPRLESLRADPIDSVLAKAMAKDPFRRFDTCREFATALADSVKDMASATDTTQLANKVATPSGATPSIQRLRYRDMALVAGGIAVLLVIGVVAFIGARLGRPAPPQSVPTPPLPSGTLPGPGSAEPSQTVTVTQPGTAPTIGIPPRTSTPLAQPAGDLGLGMPMSKPSCDGQGIIVLGSVTTPGMYAAGVQMLLDAHPGSFYLRTDQTCPSLRAANDEGNPIYAVFIPGGTTQSQVCAAVHKAGGNAYGKWLDFTTDPAYVIPC